ncbi:MAG: hypothetical protein QNK23_16240 [Crocinitomicaceae bacterium]|nr:hypothetical protein [Crocinitomicaceae bacterium]
MMSAEVSLLIGVGLFLLVGITIYSVVTISYLRDRKNLTTQWRDFQESLKCNDSEEIVRLSWLLLKNMYLDKKQLEEIKAEINEKLNDHREYDELVYIANNKRLVKDTWFPGIKLEKE